MKYGSILLFLVVLAACEAPQREPALALVEGAGILGLSLRELPEATLRSIGLPYGLAVVKVDAATERAGLRLGDVVYGVNQTRIRSVAEFTRLVAKQPAGVLGLLVRRGKLDFYVSVEQAGAPQPHRGMPKVRRPATDTLLRT